MWEEETHNSPETSKNGCRHSTLMPLEVVEIQRCNNVGIEWYSRMPTDPPLVAPKGKKLPPEREDATLEATDPRTGNLPPH